MTGASLRYLIKEGFRNTWTNRMMSIASICVLMSCLVLIGSASMIFLNMDSLLSRIEEENVIMVYIKDDANQAAIDTMGQEIKALGNVKELEYVPKEKAWAQQLETMEDAQAKFFTQISSDIPLPNAYKVTVADLGKFDQTVKGLKALKNVDTIRENKDLAQKLVSIRQGITVISIVIIGVLFAISLFIISNTIKLTVYSRRLERGRHQQLCAPALRGRRYDPWYRVRRCVAGAGMGSVRAGGAPVRRPAEKPVPVCAALCPLCAANAGHLCCHRYY